MKTIIKIVLALAVLTAAAQAGLAALANYQFQDAVHEALIFSPNSSDSDIKDTVVELATKQGLPVGLEDVTVRQVGPDLLVDVTYETEVRLLPGIYARNVRFNPSTSTRLMPGVRRR
jgi:hypothetical protein